MTHETIVIGAGLAGLAAASRLRAEGQNVLVLEKSRGLGGRAATRRWDGLPVDHGAQFFTARSAAFQEQVRKWISDGVCHEWATGFHQFRNGRLQPPQDDAHPRYACRNGMSSLGKAIAGGAQIPVQFEVRAASLEFESGHWKITVENGASFQARRLVVAVPPPQAAELLGTHAPDFLRSIQFDPCLALAARYPERKLDWQGIQSDAPSVSWIGHDTSKRPGLHAGQTVVVVHAPAEFSRTHFSDPEETTGRHLLETASEISGVDLRQPAATFLQRWRYATTTTPPGSEPAVRIGAPAPLILAGESFAGGKIEGAWLSGMCAADLLTKRP